MFRTCIESWRVICLCTVLCPYLACSSRRSEVTVPRKGGDVKVSLGQTLTFWADPHASLIAYYGEPTKWSMVFRSVRTQKIHPYRQSSQEPPAHTYLRKYHGARPLGWAGDDARYLVVGAVLKNLDDEKQYAPWVVGTVIQVKTDTGEAFDGHHDWRPERTKPEPRNRWEKQKRYINVPIQGDVMLEPGGEVKAIFWSRIPEDTDPTQLVGLIGGTSFGEEGVTRFRLNLRDTLQRQPGSPPAQREELRPGGDLPGPGDAAAAPRGDLSQIEKELGIRVVRQDSQRDCARACALMVLQYYGRPVDPGEAQRLIPGNAHITNDLASGLSKLGRARLSADYFRTSQSEWLEFLKTQIRADRPIITLLPKVEALAWWKSSYRGPHYVVVTGFGSEGSVVCNDPVYGRQVAGKGEFEEAWGSTHPLAKYPWQGLVVTDRGSGGAAGPR